MSIAASVDIKCRYFVKLIGTYNIDTSSEVIYDISLNIINEIHR
ncbi:MAG: hypothetical protein K0S01_1460 [Herbinix sp.]|jgi:hypothetical protein|nr:hypothetical protein [Herbinix sp.]